MFRSLSRPGGRLPEFLIACHDTLLYLMRYFCPALVLCVVRMQDVAAVVSCTAAIVRPKEGDGPERAKYFQGITFYEPEVCLLRLPMPSSCFDP